jgi:hypothetical protein
MYSFRGMKIGLDCANGSASVCAQRIFEGLGARVIMINDKPDGTNINEGCGNIDLTFDCGVLKTQFGNGTSEVTLKGQSSYTEINMRSYGVVHAENLNSNFVRVQSYSTNDAYVWARTKLTVWLHSIGNVYYKGNPWVVKECYGDGQVIKLE